MVGHLAKFVYVNQSIRASVQHVDDLDRPIASTHQLLVEDADLRAVYVLVDPLEYLTPKVGGDLHWLLHLVVSVELGCLVFLFVSRVYLNRRTVFFDPSWASVRLRSLLFR